MRASKRARLASSSAWLRMGFSYVLPPPPIVVASIASYSLSVPMNFTNTIPSP